MGRRSLVFLLLSCPFLLASCMQGGTGGAPSAMAAITDPPQELGWVEVRLGDHPLRIMIARTEEQKQKGLMFRRSLGEDEGMLFVYDTPHRMTFWMKNTWLPLDLVFFSEDLEVTDLIEGMVPGVGIPDADLPRYTSAGEAQYALELASGSVRRLAVTPGTRLQVPLPYLHFER